MRQLTLPIRAAARLTFESFVAGQNSVAVAQLLDLTSARDGAPPPVYLWGPAGSGKSHLLGALAERWRSQGADVALFDASSPLPWPLDDRRVMTIFDGCDAFDAQQQQAAFALFVDASSRGARVAAAGRVPPIDLPLRDDLRSRLGWGHILALQPLGEAEVKAVLDGEAKRRGLVLPEDLSAYLLNHFARDLKSLMALLDLADEFALSRQRALSIPLLKQMLQEQAAGIDDR